jgi:tRNA-modifying protein YgfZ
VPMGTESWEEARICCGLPVPGRELTELYNPLEAGLCHATSLNKGCYVGQETLAKVHNTNGELPCLTTCTMTPTLQQHAERQSCVC